MSSKSDRAEICSRYGKTMNKDITIRTVDPSLKDSDFKSLNSCPSVNMMNDNPQNINIAPKGVNYSPASKSK